MIVRYKIGNAWVEIEAETTQEIFRKFQAAKEIFLVSKCGLCGSENVLPNYRKSGGHDYYEMRCECRAVFGFGETKEDHVLFPRRKKDGEWLPNDGWSKYEKPQEEGGL